MGFLTTKFSPNWTLIKMHFADGTTPLAYRRYIQRKALFLATSVLLLFGCVILALSLGAASVPFSAVIRTLCGLPVEQRLEIIIWHIRLPQVLTACVAGAGLAGAGAAMQAILRNPLGSPFTLGISHAAAFGAALAVMLLGATGLQSTEIAGLDLAGSTWITAAAFLASLSAAAVILLVSRLRGSTPETMVLTGVALGALFTAGTMFLQFFADDMELAAMVFWTFGDTARATWGELGALTAATLLSGFYFYCHSWNYNAIEAGETTAKGLGVRVNAIRLTGMLVATLVTAIIIAFLGIIGFVGLVVPHMVRRCIGADHRFLLPASLLMGAILLLASDTVARLLLAPQVLPVSVLTAFLGAPVFLLLILRGKRL